MATAQLNPAQREAVKTLRGPLLVLAGAGSGKTRVITYRIAELIRSGVKPGRILAVTFTNKAAREMRQRVTSLLGRRRKNASTPEISTFHSLCVRILRRHISELGYPAQFPIYDRSDQESVARKALREIRVGQETLRPSDLLSLIGSWKSAAVRPAQAIDLAQSERERLGAAAYAKYQESLKASGAVDFDDLLLLTEDLFDGFPQIRFDEAYRFDHVLIDEYQDTNAPQYRLVQALAERHQNLCVVGDDDQSIYGWRGAEVTHILNFANDWPSTKVVRLEHNYRSTPNILKLANTLIAHNSTRHQKVLRPVLPRGEPPRFVKFDDETSEASSIAREISQLIDSERSDRLSPSDIAILFRTNEQPRAFELELRRQRVPYVLVGGQSFYDRKEIRDVLAYLKLLAHPSDEVSLLRVINTPSRGIGSASVQSLLKRAVASGRSLWRVVTEDLRDEPVPAPVARRIEDFTGLVQRFAERTTREALSEVTRDLLLEIGYRAELERIYKSGPEVESRWASIEELVNALAQFEARTEQPTVQAFLEEITLNGRDDLREEQDGKQERAVTLMTLHSAKGLEFPVVYLVGLEEGLLPHQRSILESLSGGNPIAEERRLCYVGVTRAQSRLTLSFAAQRMKWGKPRPSIPSRFLMEMRGETDKAQRAALAAEQLAAGGTSRPGAAPKGAQPAHDDAATMPSTKDSRRSTAAAPEARRAGAPRRTASPAKTARKRSERKQASVGKRRAGR